MFNFHDICRDYGSEFCTENVIHLFLHSLVKKTKRKGYLVTNDSTFLFARVSSLLVEDYINYQQES